MKKLFILFAIFTTFATTAQSVGINADGGTPNASAILDVSSTTKGFLPPRMTYTERNTISSPAAGLVVWCSNCETNGELQLYNGTTWTNMIGGAANGIFPKLSAIIPTNIGATTATSGGNVTDNGGSYITARGVCWSTSPYPTISNDKTTENGFFGTGSFTASITGLVRGTTYYLRAYATNNEGTGYSAQVIFSTSNPQIGQAYLGGILAYILAPGDPGYDANVFHGLIAAPSDQVCAASRAGCPYPAEISGASGTAIGTGNQNTIEIINSCGQADIPARLCADLVVGGYSDWYLPSKDELDKLFINRLAIGGFNTSGMSGGSGWYWSSSIIQNYDAWGKYFVSGSNQGQSYNYVSMYAPNSVRAIRSF